MKAELTSGTRGKFYRKSTPSSRIKKASKKIGKAILKTTGGVKNFVEGGIKHIKNSPNKKRLKVKDMPRKQQMAVKASMAEQAAGKKSPAKKKTEAAKRLLKAVPNQKAYNKLSDIEKKEFNKAAKKAKLPMKKAPA